MSGFYANGPNAAAFQALIDQWQQANPGATRRYGGGPGDVGFGPGIMPDWYGGTAKQQAAVNSVAGNPNLEHGWQASPIPQWQIDAEYPGGTGWQEGVTPMPPGWQSQAGPSAPSFGGGPQHQGGSLGFDGGPQHQGQTPGRQHGGGFLGPPVQQGGREGGYGDKGAAWFLGQLGAKHPDLSFKTRQQMRRTY